MHHMVPMLSTLERLGTDAGAYLDACKHDLEVALSDEDDSRKRRVFQRALKRLDKRWDEWADPE